MGRRFRLGKKIALAELMATPVACGWAGAVLKVTCISAAGRSSETSILGHVHIGRSRETKDREKEKN